MKRQYEFNNGTLVVLPNGKESSLVYEDGKRYIVEDLPMEIMEESCKYFGSTYKGRKDGVRDLLGVEYKVPIIIEASSALIAFPTCSPDSVECCWVAFNRVDDIEEIDDENTKIIFDNGTEVIVPCSFRSLENQISRCARLKFILDKRKSS